MNHRNKLTIKHRKVKGKTIIEVMTDDELKAKKERNEIITDIVVSALIGSVITILSLNILSLIFLT